MTVTDAPARPAEGVPSPPRRRRGRGGAHGLGPWRLAARLARRELLRRPGRTALMALLIAVPVAGTVVGMGLATTPQVRWQRLYGVADLATARSVADQTLLPGTRVADVRAAFIRLRASDGRRSGVQVVTAPPGDPLTDGLVTMVEGRMPREAGEVLLAPQVARDLALRVGDTLAVDRPARARLTVTGLGVRPLDPLPLFLTTPGNPVGDALSGGELHLLTVDRSVPEAQLRDWLRGWTIVNSTGATPFRPGLVSDPIYDYDASGFSLGPITTTGTVVGAWSVGALALTVLGIVVVAAFAAGNRRRLVTVGLLGANGAPPRIIRRLLLLEGVGAGAVGALAGVALGVSAVAGWATLAGAEHTASAPMLSEIRPVDVVPVVVFAVLTATVAALVPARSTARLPVLASLAGRRPTRAVPRAVTIAGVTMVMGGTALVAVTMAWSRLEGPAASPWLAVLSVVGAATTLLGMTAATPASVSLLGPLGTRLPGSWRLACRSLARRRAHTAAMVSAVLATAALTMAGATVVAASPSFDPPGADRLRGTDQAAVISLRDNVPVALPADVVADMAARLPGSRVLPTIRVKMPAGAYIESEESPAGEARYFDGVVIADRAALDAYRLDDRDRALLRETGAFEPGIADGSYQARIRFSLGGQMVTDGPDAFPVAVGARPADRAVRWPVLLVTPERAAELGMATQPGPVIVNLAGPVTTHERAVLDGAADRATDIIDDAGPPNGVATVYVDTGSNTGALNQAPFVNTALVTTALAVTLIVVAAGLALAAAETREERDLLLAVGAAPRTVRRTSARRALVLVALGCVLAVPTGWLPAAAALSGQAGAPVLVFPWTVVALLVLVLPVATALTVAVGSAVGLRLRPVRMSTMTRD